LYKLLKSDTKANDVLVGYSKSGTLTEKDRKIIVEAVIRWLLQITELYVLFIYLFIDTISFNFYFINSILLLNFFIFISLQHRYYKILASKICDQFPTEEVIINIKK